jgi:hypothetical protein
LGDLPIEFESALAKDLDRLLASNLPARHLAVNRFGLLRRHIPLMHPTADDVSRVGCLLFARSEIYWSDETYSIFEIDRAAKPTFDLVLQRVYPDDRFFVLQTLGESTKEKMGFDVEYRL